VLLASLLGSQSSQELVLLFQSLESAVTVLGRSVDELEVEGLVVRSLGGGDEALAESDSSLAGTRDAALEHDPVLIDLSVVGEATHRGDALLSEIGFGGGRLVVLVGTDAEDALVDLSSVMVALLTGTGHTDRHTSRMPSTNTGDLAEASVGLAGKTSDSPTGNDTGKAVTAVGGTDIDDLSLSEHGCDLHLLLEQATSKVNLGGDITTVHLHLQKVGNFLSELDLADLSVGKDTDDLAVLLDAVDFSINFLRLLSGLLGVLGESFPLASVPVLVKSSLDVIRKMVGPNGGQRAETIWSFNVANNTNNHHWWGFKDGDGLHSFLLVQLGSRTFDVTNNVGHTSLVSNKGGEVRRKSGIVTRE